MSETKTNLPACMLALSKLGATVWRNNTGQGWVGTGQAVKIYRAGTASVHAGDVLLRQARPFHAGLCVGSSDLVGHYPVTITPEMVGRTVAVALYPEVKRKTALRGEQQQFLELVLSHGAIAGVVRDEEDCVGLIDGWKRGQV